jgi:hypothetical protein
MLRLLSVNDLRKILKRRRTRKPPASDLPVSGLSEADEDRQLEEFEKALRTAFQDILALPYACRHLAEWPYTYPDETPLWACVEAIAIIKIGTNGRARDTARSLIIALANLYLPHIPASKRKAWEPKLREALDSLSMPQSRVQASTVARDFWQKSKDGP